MNRDEANYSSISNRASRVIQQIFHLATTAAHRKQFPDPPGIVAPATETVAQTHANLYGGVGPSTPPPGRHAAAGRSAEANANTSPNANTHNAATELSAIPTAEQTTSAPLLLRINILDAKTQRRIMPRFDLPVEQCETLAALRQHALQRYSSTATSPNASEEEGLASAEVRVLLAGGLVRVARDGEWVVALLEAQGCEWMDGEVKVVVLVDEATDDPEEYEGKDGDEDGEGKSEGGGS